MLSRIAESLFWIGRYVERAEDTARILDVNIHYLLEAPSLDESHFCRRLLDGMGVEVPGREPLDAQTTTELLAFDPRNPSSIVSSLTAARANARGVSEAISSEMWEALNATYNTLPGQVGLGRRIGPYGFFRFVRERSAILAGLTDSTMSRDDAWRFLILGRNLERTDMLARLIGTGVTAVDDGAGEDTDWVMMLRSCSAHEAFLRTYSREPDARSATEFLVLDRLFPRSIFCALTSAESVLTDLAPRSSRTGSYDEARRILGQVRTELEYRRIEDMLPELPDRLERIQQCCSAASAALAARYFRSSAAIEWVLETSEFAVPAEIRGN